MILYHCLPDAPPLCPYTDGEIILINGGAAGGVGTALLQLGKLANLKKMYGTASYRKNKHFHQR
jgi:NADPH:quinone reductase-like Zn-dependent oxidoreductase